MIEHSDEVDIQLALGYTAAMGAMLVDEVLMVVDKVPLLPVWYLDTKLIGDVLGQVHWGGNEDREWAPQGRDGGVEDPVG